MADEAPKFVETTVRPLHEIFTHDYIATVNIALQPNQTASLELRIGDRTYPLVTLETHGNSVMLDKVHVHGWRKREAT
jgi:hypothetical protein